MRVSVRVVEACSREQRIHTAVEFVAFVDTVIDLITTHVCLQTSAIQTLEHASTTHYTRQPTTKLI